jgi:hypothetical protein
VRCGAFNVTEIAKELNGSIGIIEKKNCSSNISDETLLVRLDECMLFGLGYIKYELNGTSINSHVFGDLKCEMKISTEKLVIDGVSEFNCTTGYSLSNITIPEEVIETATNTFEATLLPQTTYLL